MQLHKPLFFVALYLISINLIASHDSEKFSYEKSYYAQVIDFVEHDHFTHMEFIKNHIEPAQKVK